jgi:hypothetical protein
MTTKAELASIAELTNKHSARLAAYAEQGATDAELAAIFGVPVAALAQFEQLLAKSRAELAGRVRRAMLEAGDKGDAYALSYLAEQYLKEYQT